MEKIMSLNVELNVGGKPYTTSVETLTRDCDSLLAKVFSAPRTQWSTRIPTDNQGRFFIDRDGDLFRYILDYLRNDCKLILPTNFAEHDRLKMEADYFKLAGLTSLLSTTGSLGVAMKSMSLAASCSPSAQPASPLSPGQVSGYITIGYRGSFSFGKDGLSDVKFRKLMRILVAGKVVLCREVFGDTLNESRDPDHTSFQDRYTSRFYLKHQVLEQCFDALQENGFRCVASCGSGTSCGSGELKPGQDSEENRWSHYNEFVFCRP